MTSYVLKVNERRPSGKMLVNYLKSLSETDKDIVLIPKEEKPYDEEFVEQILVSMKSEGKSVKLEDIWK